MGWALHASPQSLHECESGINFGDLTALLYVQHTPKDNSSRLIPRGAWGAAPYPGILHHLEALLAKTCCGFEQPVMMPRRFSIVGVAVIQSLGGVRSKRAQLNRH